MGDDRVRAHNAESAICVACGHPKDYPGRLCVCRDNPECHAAYYCPGCGRSDCICPQEAKK